jgi:hypothetical protein
MTIFSLVFWKAALGRAVWTFAQALGSLITLTGLTVVHIDWSTDLYVAGVAALLSVLKSVSSLYPIVTDTSAPAPQAETPAQIAEAAPVADEAIFPEPATASTGKHV